MPYLQNSIGNFNFIALQGRFIPQSSAVTVDSRPGVDGIEFTLTGTKGQPFQLVSLADTNTMDSASTMVESYKALQAAGSVGVWQDGKIMGNAKVLNVTPVRQQAIANAVGNKQSVAAGALLECVWDLIAAP